MHRDEPLRRGAKPMQVLRFIGWLWLCLGLVLGGGGVVWAHVPQEGAVSFAKHYQSTLKLDRDPLNEDGGLYLYAFCGNDPVDYVDPWGLNKLREFIDNLFAPRDPGIKRPDGSIYYPPLPLPPGYAEGDPLPLENNQHGHLAMRSQMGCGVDNRFVNKNHPEDQLTASELLGEKIPLELFNNAVAVATTCAVGGGARNAAGAAGKSGWWQRLLSFFKREKCAAETTTVAAKTGADSALQAARLNEHLRQLEKYGQAGFKELESGRIRYYGNIDPATKSGEMAGRRLVREWDPSTGAARTWHETIDQAGRVRIVRPETGGSKVHYMFDEHGNYTGSF